jgi:hypothetical protein
MKSEEGVLQEIIRIAAAGREPKAKAIKPRCEEVVKRVESAVVAPCIPPHQLTELLHLGIHAPS